MKEEEMNRFRSYLKIIPEILFCEIIERIKEEMVTEDCSRQVVADRFKTILEEIIGQINKDTVALSELEISHLFKDDKEKCYEFNRLRKDFLTSGKLLVSNEVENNNLSKVDMEAVNIKALDDKFNRYQAELKKGLPESELPCPTPNIKQKKVAIVNTAQTSSAESVASPKLSYKEKKGQKVNVSAIGNNKMRIDLEGKDKPLKVKQTCPPGTTGTIEKIDGPFKSWSLGCSVRPGQKPKNHPKKKQRWEF